jgi:hypothetical protein
MQPLVCVPIVSFQVPTAANVEMVVFRVDAACSLVKFTDFSDVLAASIMGAIYWPRFSSCY